MRQPLPHMNSAGMKILVPNVTNPDNRDRHKDITVIETIKITDRKFPCWSMGFKNMDTSFLPKAEGLGDLVEDGLTASSPVSNKNMIGLLIRLLRTKLLKAASAGNHEELQNKKH
jgi:hypothetical protein